MRINLPSSTPTAHPNLLMDRYLVELKRIAQKETPDMNEWRRVIGIAPPSSYRLAFDRWKLLFPTSENRVIREGSVSGRFVTGLGAESVFEINVRLHHTYGVPFVPSSGLKGALRAYLEHTMGKPKEADFLFGKTDGAGYARVYDSWWVPGSATTPSGLALDVLSVHHQDYYARKAIDGQPAPPSDFDQPVPVHFLTAQGRFLFIIEGPNQEWASFLEKLLSVALQVGGVGAKKTSGYGRFSF